MKCWRTILIDDQFQSAFGYITINNVSGMCQECKRVTSDVNQPDKLHNNEFINHLVVYLAEG